MATQVPFTASLSPERSPAQAIYALYAALSATATQASIEAQSGLGGKLLYAGKIDGAGRDLLFAGNIAGAASLAASSDAQVLRNAIRDGVVDFVVTSLDEALRILKNEVRKRQAVSVGVKVDSVSLVDQMLVHGVLPDIFPPATWPAAATGVSAQQYSRFMGLGSLPVSLAFDLDQVDASFVTWSVDRQTARWLPRLDLCVTTLLPAEDRVRQRWLRLAPRYLGRMVQRQHGVVLSRAEASIFRAAAKSMAALHREQGEEPVQVEIGGEPLF